MSEAGLIAALRGLSWIVLAAIVVAVGYGGWIALTNWSGIAV